jgi:glyoxylase-like metal-dependent hydrolase (beta-lactamase superfamily II)
MSYEIKTINAGGVNCYLVTTTEGYVLIDTGWAFKRATLDKVLEDAGCLPGNLRLIVITHADADHTGNCAYLQHKYGVPVAMHPAEANAAASANMLLSRTNRPLPNRIVFTLTMVFARMGRYGRFQADFYLEDGQDLSEYGFEARVLHVPSHSTGSIAVLTEAGDLFCGDMMSNTDGPAAFLVDNQAAFDAAMQRFKGLEINTVYPGHGQPFPMKAFM